MAGRGAAPETHYAWRPGAAPPRPPRAPWPRAAGIVLAVAAQLALYLALRHVAIATMPPWAHRHPARLPGPWPDQVRTQIVRAGGEAAPAPPVIVPVLIPPPSVDLPVPDLGSAGTAQP